MGFFGGKATNQQPQKDSQSNPNYIQDDDDSKLPVAVAVENTKDPEVGLFPPPSAPPTDKMNPTIPTYHATTSNLPQQQHRPSMRLEFTTRFPTVVPQCPHCSALHVRTTTRTFPTLLTWVAVLILLIIFWPLFWLPLVIDQCRHTTHICTNCNTEIGQVPAFHDCCVRYR